MAIEIEDHFYEIVIGTDVSRPDARNGVFVEMQQMDSPDQPTVLFAFRSNADGKITISMYRQDMPLEVLTYFVRVASEELSTERWPIS